MAIKDLLLLLTPGRRGEGASRFALSLAQTMGARLTVVGVVVEFMPPSSFVADFPSQAAAEAARNARAELEKAYSALAAPGVATELAVIQTLAGDAREQVSRFARCYDVVIAGQAAPGAPEDAGELAEAALFGSGRAVFMVPYIHSGPAKLDRALVAWDGGLPAARAVAEAIPALSLAKEIEVVAVSAAGQDAPSTDGIVRHLARHGATARGRTLPSDGGIGPILLSYAADFGADYLVMGAYGHSRMREFILGGVTREILKSMTVPTLMAH